MIAIRKVAKAQFATNGEVSVDASQMWLGGDVIDAPLGRTDLDPADVAVSDLENNIINNGMLI